MNFKIVNRLDQEISKHHTLAQAEIAAYRKKGFRIVELDTGDKIIPRWITDFEQEILNRAIKENLIKHLKKGLK